MLIDICMKFREDSSRGFQVTERTRFVTDRRLGKNNMSPNPEGGRHNSEFGQPWTAELAALDQLKKSFTY